MKETTISKKTETKDARDFSFLRQKGLEHIQELSRKLWTDYNSHDPGITFLEALCYAVTDLGNRIHLPIRDLIGASDGADATLEKSFPTAKQILTTGPVTEKDYRKLFIDIEGVKNAFIHVEKESYIYSYCLQKEESEKNLPYGKLSYKTPKDANYEHYKNENNDKFNLNGLYNIRFEPSYNILFEGSSTERKKRIDDIIDKIKKRYHANRNLCEDVVEVEEIESHKILICGNIGLDHDANAVDTLVEILFRIQKYLSPSIKRYSLEQLLDAGIAVEDIFDGPVLENGFIRDDELEKAKIKTKVHLSDLIQIVTETPGVADVRKLKMASCNNTEGLGDKISADEWTLCLDNDNEKLLKLCLDRSIEVTNLFKDVIPVDVKTSVIKDRLKKRMQEHHEQLQTTYDDLSIKEGRKVDTGSYSTIQNDLPQIYGTDEFGLSSSLPEERQAKALQLKGYLLFFDQILATYFGHLKHVGNLLSADIGDQSYFTTFIEGGKDFELLIQNDTNYKENVEQVLDDLDNYKDRKSDFLDHLLARFAENMNKYVFAMLDDFGEDITEATLWHKATLLKEYPEISYNRAAAFNYYGAENDIWNTNNVAGLKHRLSRLLGIKDYSRCDLATLNYDIYQVKDQDELEEWRWRVKNEKGEILFSATKNYEDRKNAIREMWTGIYLASEKPKCQIIPTEPGDKYYFNIVSPKGEIFACHYHYYKTKQEVQKVIDEIAQYLAQSVAEEGMLVFENILFRPDRNDDYADDIFDYADDKFMKICMKPDCSQCKPADPYSMRLTIVFPGWVGRFSNLHFREYAEKVIRREVPAHIMCRICWIGNTIETKNGKEIAAGGPMTRLQTLYRKWLTEKMKPPENQQNNEHLKPLVDLLHDVETVYPVGHLHDCSKAAGEDSKVSIVLGKTKIGELKRDDYENKQ